MPNLRREDPGLGRPGGALLSQLLTPVMYGGVVCGWDSAGLVVCGVAGVVLGWVMVC